MHPSTTTKKIYVFHDIQPSTHYWTVRHSFINLCVRGINSLENEYELFYLHGVLSAPKAKRQENNINEVNHITNVTCIN